MDWWYKFIQYYSSADVSGTGNYMYTETSGIGSNKTAELKSYCIDASAVTNRIRFLLPYVWSNTRNITSKHKR